MSIKFSGINIISKDPVKSFEFYKGLGLPVKEEAEANSTWYGASFDLGGTTLWIWRDNSGNDVENVGRTIMQIVLGLENIDKSYADFKSKGYVVGEIERMFYGGREMNLTDPDGNKILFLD